MKPAGYTLSILGLVCLQGFVPADEPRLEMELRLGHTSFVESVAFSGDG